MNDLEVFKGACCLAGADSAVTIEELTVLRKLAADVGMDGGDLDTLMSKAAGDTEFLEQETNAVMRDTDGAMSSLIRITRQAHSPSEGHVAMLLWRIANKMGVKPERFEELLGQSADT